MTLSRLFFLISLLLFGTIGILSVVKKGARQQSSAQSEQQTTLGPNKAIQAACTEKGAAKEKVDMSLLQTSVKSSSTVQVHSLGNKELVGENMIADADRPAEEVDRPYPIQKDSSIIIEHDDEPEAIAQLFTKGSSCPIVETVRYSSRASWKPKKQAWLIDYANYYKTPLDFIVHSITGRSGSNAPAIKEGQQFTVLRSNVPFYFHAVISFASMKMRLYYVLPQENKAVFLKSYPVCLGRKDPSKSSGSLTPFGVFMLGQRVACFKPKMMGTHKGHRIELMQVFGTRWIPFDKEITGCTEPAKGFGIHGAPFVRASSDAPLTEDASSIGTWASDGCVRLRQQDVEELFSVISTRKSFVEIIPDFRESSLLKGQLLQVQ